MNELQTAQAILLRIWQELEEEGESLNSSDVLVEYLEECGLIESIGYAYGLTEEGYNTVKSYE